MTSAKRTVRREMPMTNAERMYALDEPWNARNRDTFDFFHDQEATVVYWRADRWARSTRSCPAGTTCARWLGDS
jgi:hypothetical protein